MVPDIDQICFGLDRKTDERSLITFIKAFAGRDLLATLVPRMEDDEITAVVNTLTGLMKRHFSEQEYHRLFLSEPSTREP